MFAKNALLFAAFALLLAPLLHADTSGVGDWDGQLFVNGSLALDGTPICLYVNGVENSRTTVGAQVSGYYLLHGVGATGDNITFKVFCEYDANEGAQNWSASPPRHHLNLSIAHSNGPALVRIAPAATGVAKGAVTLIVSSNESATCRYSTSSGLSYAQMNNTTTTALGTTHSWSVSAPLASTAYYYYARCINQFNLSSDELSLSFTTSSGGGGGGGGGGGNSGGGNVGGGGAGVSTRESANYSVDMGGGKYCIVTITREMTSGQNLSVLTTTLENMGGIECNMQNFTFSDTIPAVFPAINEITFNPMYVSRVGWQVSFNFPTFAGGESKTLTYSVNGWVGSSKVNNFTIYEMTANKKQPAAAPTQPVQPIAPSTNETPSWIPTKLPDIFGPQPVANATQPPVQPAPNNNFMSLVITALIVIVVVAGILGLVIYLRRRKKESM